MGKWKICMAVGLMILLAGCAQQVEREPVSIKDEKAEMDPAKSQTAASEEGRKSIQTAEKQSGGKVKGVKEQLAEVSSLEEAPEELKLQENTDGKSTEIKLMLQKCDGGYAFYFPEHKDEKLAWFKGEENEDAPEEMLVYGVLYPFYNGAGMKMTFTHYENSTLDYAKNLVSGVDVIKDDADNTYTINMDMPEADIEECTIGAGNYPALRTPKLTIPATYVFTTEDAALQEAGNIEASGANEGGSQPKMTVQYYFVEVPEGLLRISFDAPAEGMEASWADAEEILDSMIIEDKDTYDDYHSAVSVNSQNKELKFKNLQILRLFYDTCLTRGDYESAMKVSKNIEPLENGKEVWEKMECYSSGPIEFLERNNRAVLSCFLIINELDDTALPKYQDGGQELLRYMYFVKEGDYWYLDGPLHNGEPAEAWWQGEVTSWNVQDYGLSDSSEPGATVSSPEQITEVMDSWAEKLK